MHLFELDGDFDAGYHGKCPFLPLLPANARLLLEAQITNVQRVIKYTSRMTTACVSTAYIGFINQQKLFRKASILEIRTTIICFPKLIPNAFGKQ